MNIEKSSANHAILDSGSAITFDNSAELTFKIQMDENFDFSLVLKFESNGNEKQSISQKTVDNMITINCINFNNPLGTGTTQPIQLATYNGKKIYFTFFVYALGKNALRKIVYSFYSEI